MARVKPRWKEKQINRKSMMGNQKNKWKWHCQELQKWIQIIKDEAPITYIDRIERNNIFVSWMTSTQWQLKINWALVRANKNYKTDQK